jgi:hypothetical protein
MTTKRTFHLLIATTWLMPLAANLLSAEYSFASKSSVAINPTAGFVLHPLSGMHVLVVAFTLLLFIAAIVVCIGLWFFRNWARIIYLPLGAFYVWWWPYGMPTPHLPIALADLTTFITFGSQGATAAMSFLPPLSALFKQSGLIPGENRGRSVHLDIF